MYFLAKKNWLSDCSVGYYNIYNNIHYAIQNATLTSKPLKPILNQNMPYFGNLLPRKQKTNGDWKEWSDSIGQTWK